MNIKGETHMGGVRYEISRDELSGMTAQQFKNGDIIECGKYFISITYQRGDKTFDRASLLTTVNSVDSLCNIPIAKQPQYVRNFIVGNNESKREIL